MYRENGEGTAVKVQHAFFKAGGCQSRSLTTSKNTAGNSS